MLVLTRMAGESIVIGDRLVVVTVKEIRGDKVRLSFEADGEIIIDREEVFDRKKKEYAIQQQRDKKDGVNDGKASG